MKLEDPDERISIALYSSCHLKSGGGAPCWSELWQNIVLDNQLEWLNQLHKVFKNL